MLLDYTVNTVYLYPEKNIQIIRFGDSLSYKNYWQDIFIQIIDQLNEVKIRLSYNILPQV
jgi:hypothetical protein